MPAPLARSGWRRGCVEVDPDPVAHTDLRSHDLDTAVRGEGLRSRKSGKYGVSRRRRSAVPPQPPPRQTGHRARDAACPSPYVQGSRWRRTAGTCLVLDLIGVVITEKPVLRAPRWCNLRVHGSTSGNEPPASPRRRAGPPSPASIAPLTTLATRPDNCPVPGSATAPTAGSRGAHRARPRGAPATVVAGAHP